MIGKKSLLVPLLFVLVLILVSALATAAADPGLSPMEQLGKSIFFDENLSINQNQSCASCHGPEVGFTGPDTLINAVGAVYEGSIPGRFGDRKPPSAAYATQSPNASMTRGPGPAAISGTAGPLARNLAIRQPIRLGPIP